MVYPKSACRRGGARQQGPCAADRVFVKTGTGSASARRRPAPQDRAARPGNASSLCSHCCQERRAPARMRPPQKRCSGVLGSRTASCQPSSGCAGATVSPPTHEVRQQTSDIAAAKAHHLSALREIFKGRCRNGCSALQPGVVPLVGALLQCAKGQQATLERICSSNAGAA